MSAWDMALQQGQAPDDENFLAQFTNPQRNPATVYRPAPPPPSVEPKREPAGKVLPRDIASMPFNPLSVMGSKEALQAYLAKQQEGVEKLQSIADQSSASMDKPNQNPFAGLLALADNAFGSKTLEAAHALGAVKPIMSEQEKLDRKAKLQEMVDKARTPIATEMLKQYGNENNALTRALAGQINSGKADKKTLDKMETDMGNDLDQFKASSRSLTGVMAAKLHNSNQILALVARHPDMNLTKDEMFDLVAGVAKQTLGNQGVIGEDMLNKLMPDSARGKYNDWKAWLLNEPTGKEQQGFVKRMVDNLLGEEKSVREQFDNEKLQKLTKYGRLEEARPAVHARIASGPDLGLRRPKVVEDFVNSYNGVTVTKTGKDGKVETYRMKPNSPEYQEAIKEGFKEVK